MMRDALQETQTLLNAREEGLYQKHLTAAIASGGVVHLSTSCVFIGMPFNDGVLVLFCCGDGRELGDLCGLMARRYDMAYWKREFKKGYQGLKSAPLSKFARLIERMYPHHG